MGEKLEGSKRGIVIAGGDIQNYQVVKKLIQQGDRVVCADSGYLHCVKMGITPDIIVGDFDSLTIEIPESISQAKLPEDKNYSDTTFALEILTQQGYDNIVLIGMMGGRRIDHALANIQSLVYCVRKGISAYITDGETQIFCVQANGEKLKKVTFAPLENHYFSLLSYSEQCIGVTIENAKYLLDDYTLTCDLARAISNEFMGEDVTVSFKRGTMLIVFSPKD